jgi:hypothetical protein
MNCKDTQAAIDSASRRNPISQLASVHAAGCSDCRGYMDQSNALLALLSAQPRVEAPADFDFRLRARIARAESQPSGGPVAVLSNFFGLSFSIKQAAGSLAALAVMAAVTTFYFTNGTQPMTSQGSMIARVETAVPQAPGSAVVAEAKTVAVPNEELSRPAATRVVSNSYAGGARMRSAMMTESPVREVRIASNVAGREGSIRVFNRERGQIMEASNRTTVYGVERSLAASKPQVDAGF